MPRLCHVMLLSFASTMVSGAACSGDGCHVPVVAHGLLQRSSSSKLASIASIGSLESLEAVLATGPPAEQLAVVQQLVKEVMAKSSSQSNQSQPVAWQVRTNQSNQANQSNQSKSLDQRAYGTWDTLMKLHDEIENTSLQKVWEDHEAGMASLMNLEESVRKCVSHLSPSQLPRLKNTTSDLEKQSSQCQGEVTSLEEQLNTFDADLRQFTDGLDGNSQAPVAGYTGLDAASALKKLKDGLEWFQQNKERLLELKNGHENLTARLGHASSLCQNTTSDFMAVSCQLKGTISEALEAYETCREDAEELLSREWGIESERAELRKNDYAAYKKIQCYILVLNETVVQTQQALFKNCTLANYSTPDLSLGEPEDVPLDNTSELMETMHAQKACQQATTTPLMHAIQPGETCLRITTNTTPSWSSGYLEVSVDAGNGPEQVVALNFSALGHEVLNDCYPSLKSVIVQNANNDAWAGSVEISKDSWATSSYMVCTDCTSGTWTGDMAVDGNADASAGAAMCVNGAACTLHQL